MNDTKSLTRSADGYAYAFREVLLDITTSHNGKAYPTQIMVSFCGQKMMEILARYEVGDVVCVRFTPKCKEITGKYGTKYNSYNLAYRISLADGSRQQQ